MQNINEAVLIIKIVDDETDISITTSITITKNGLGYTTIKWRESIITTEGGHATVDALVAHLCLLFPLDWELWLSSFRICIEYKMEDGTSRKEYPVDLRTDDRIVSCEEYDRLMSLIVRSFSGKTDVHFQ